MGCSACSYRKLISCQAITKGWTRHSGSCHKPHDDGDKDDAPSVRTVCDDRPIDQNAPGMTLPRTGALCRLAARGHRMAEVESQASTPYTAHTMTNSPAFGGRLACKGLLDIRATVRDAYKDEMDGDGHEYDATRRIPSGGHDECRRTPRTVASVTVFLAWPIRQYTARPDKAFDGRSRGEHRLPSFYQVPWWLRRSPTGSPLLLLSYLPANEDQCEDTERLISVTQLSLPLAGGPSTSGPRLPATAWLRRRSGSSCLSPRTRDPGALGQNATRTLTQSHRTGPAARTRLPLYANGGILLRLALRGSPPNVVVTTRHATKIPLCPSNQYDWITASVRVAPPSNDQSPLYLDQRTPLTRIRGALPSHYSLPGAASSVVRRRCHSSRLLTPHDRPSHLSAR